MDTDQARKGFVFLFFPSVISIPYNSGYKLWAYTISSGFLGGLISGGGGGGVYRRNRKKFRS